MLSVVVVTSCPARNSPKATTRGFCCFLMLLVVVVGELLVVVSVGVGFGFVSLLLLLLLLLLEGADDNNKSAD